MLARAYRLTDKFGVIVVKGSGALFDTTLDGISVFVSRVLAPIGRILRPLWLLIVMLVLFFINLFRRATGQTTISAERMMARRAARAQMEAAIIEDPLRAQNRVLSTLTVALLALLIAVVLWATNPARSTALSAPINPVANVSLFAATAVESGGPTPGPLATSVPTTTPLPSVLEVRGSLAYTVRELGQTDIWAVQVGSRTGIRLTNSPEDERDPAWDNTGRRLAYASRQDGNWEIYIYDLASGETTRMTYDLSFQAGPAWSPDGDWLVHETYQNGNLDIQFLKVDGRDQPVFMPGNSPTAPDFSPSWSPDGRRIAFVSWRDGNQDIYIFSLDDQSVTNLTNTPTRHEDYPSWSPDGELIAYSALENGQETVFVKQVDDPSSTAQPQFGGRNPSWSPDGASIVFTADIADGGQLIAAPFAGAGVVTSVISVPRGSTGAAWTGSPLPQQLVNSGGVAPAVSGPLFVENVTEQRTDPPYVLRNVGVNAEPASLSDQVDDSFRALREAVLERAGWDFLGRLDDVFWALERPPEPNVERRHWLMTGRAFALQRSATVGSPPAIEVVREDIGVETDWRVYVRVVEDEQSGGLGEPLRRMPWDFASRTEGDVEAYDQGGRLRFEMPQGYYVDLTQIVLDYGWDRVPAGFDWRANSNSINYWLFRKTDGLSWYNAMREIYPEGQLINFAPTGTPIPGFENLSDATPPTAPPPIQVEPTSEGGVPAVEPTLPPQVEELLTPEGED